MAGQGIRAMFNPCKHNFHLGHCIRDVHDAQHLELTVILSLETLRIRQVTWAQ